MFDTDQSGPDGYARPCIAVARDHITALMDGFMAATGLKRTFVASFARNGDPKFAATYLVNNFSVESYDVVNSRLSAVWPADAPWPDGVPRQAPAPISADDMAELASRLAAAAAKRAGLSIGRPNFKALPNDALHGAVADLTRIVADVQAATVAPSSAKDA